MSETFDLHLRSRRDFLRLAGMSAAAVTFGGVLSACGDDTTPAGTGDQATQGTENKGTVGGTLNVLCWEGYTDAAFVKGFEEKFGATVKSTFIGSNDELVSKLRAAPNLYDLVSPSSDTTNLLIDANLVREIDQAEVPNLKTVLPFFKEAPNVFVNGKLYGVPMSWGFIPVIVDLAAVPKPSDSWNILWDKAYAGKISVWQDISTIWNTALLLGYQDVYNLTDEQLNAVKAKLVEQKPLVRKYWSTAGELTNLFLNKEVVLGNSYGGLTATQLKREGRNVREIIPKEGATAWVDNWMITRQAPNPATALAYVNYIQEPSVQKTISEVTGYGVTNTATFGDLPADYREAYHLDDPKFIEGLSFWKVVPRRQKYLDVLNEVLAA
jgi:spermidine/putrescine-binding protein